MATSHLGRLGTASFTLPIRTPGPLGHNDAASPGAPPWLVGDTPGPLGIQDHAAPSSIAVKEQVKDNYHQHRLDDEVPVPKNINLGLAVPSPDLLTAVLGKPREDFSEECEAVTNRHLASQILIANVGPFKVQGLRPAVESLKVIMAEVHREFPVVYKNLGSSGMLCCRKQRGSTKISSHSWGTAIDIKLLGLLDERGNGTVLYGLTLIAPLFNRNGWVWGAAFRKEDGMHFEVSEKKLLRWEKEGRVNSRRKCK